MTILTSETTFEILAAPEVFEESADLVLLPENAGAGAMRELHYPGDLLPPLVYEEPPDRWENFDSAPLTARPQVKTEPTLAWAQTAQWPGYLPDTSIREMWKGSDTLARMTAYFLRRLYEYFANPPAAGYITWHPKDRTAQGYNIIIESLTVGGQNTISLDAGALANSVITQEVVLQFRIIGEAD